MHSTCLAQAQLYVTPKLAMSIWRVIPLSTRDLSIHLWATLMEITHTLPKYLTRNSRWHPKFNSYNCNISFVKMQRTQSLTRPTTHAAILTFSTSHNSISSQYSQPFTSLAAPKANQYSMLHIKTLSLNTFRVSPSYIFILPLFTLKT